MGKSQPGCSYKVCSYKKKACITMLEAEMNDEIRKLNCWLIANKLSLNIAKTEFMLIGSRQRLQTQNNQHVEIQVEGKIIKHVEETKSL